MGDVYAKYCMHGNPIYYKGCPGCLALRELKAKKRHHDYMNKKTKYFWEYFKKTFGYDVKDPETKHIIPKEFSGLKRSKSQEELKKAYHKLARKFHPDKKGGSTSMFQRLHNWYERLLFNFTL